MERRILNAWAASSDAYVELNRAERACFDYPSNENLIRLGQARAKDIICLRIAERASRA